MKIEKKGNKKQKRKKLRGRGPFIREIEKKENSHLERKRDG